ncbi:MAG: hypothetical protein AAFZ38_12440 [Myxococcota bacterium]
MNRVVVFDVGNVLLRWDPVALVAKLLPEQDAPLLAERLFGGSAWQALDAGTLAFDTAVVQASNDVRLPVAHVERLFEAVGPSLTPIAPLVALADALAGQGRPGYVLSNMPAHVQAVILEEHPVFDASPDAFSLTRFRQSSLSQRSTGRCFVSSSSPPNAVCSSTTATPTWRLRANLACARSIYRPA